MRDDAMRNETQRSGEAMRGIGWHPARPGAPTLTWHLFPALGSGRADEPTGNLHASRAARVDPMTELPR